MPAAVRSSSAPRGAENKSTKVTKDGSLIIRSSRVVLPDGVRPASIHVEGGRIARIDGDRDATVDVGRLIISPGIVDTHVHVNEPGRTEWEGFDSATRAAAAGGVTTIVDMPLNSIPATTSVQALEVKRAAARRNAHVDVGFWGGVVPGNVGELDALVDAGVLGFKCFLAPSGVDEFEHVGEADLRAAMPILARRGVPLLVHAEDPDLIPDSGAGTSSYRTYAESRPPQAEVSAIELVVRLARESGARVHIVHVAAAEAVDVIARAKADGVRITAETCPHYLTFAAGEIADGATEFKCAPPIRESSDRHALWAGLVSGALDMIATDHSPAPRVMKPRGDFARAWGGIASLEVSLSAVWTARPSLTAVCPDAPVLTFVPWEAPAGPAQLARWLSAAPAALAGLRTKGRIAVGCDADLVIWDPIDVRTVDPARLQQRHKLTPYAGRRLQGVVKTTFLRGQRIWDDGALVESVRGQLL